uniref:Uncharacterized protein n=1 Tax=Panonychus citri mivirus TaxID=2760845 RepID=A0A7G4YW63_9VIRU|nr:hypothetical protein [Panonychus citri mivirus]
MAESSKKRKSDEGIEPSGKSVQTEDQFIIVGTDFTKDPLLQPPQGDMTRDTDIQDMKNKLEWMEKVSKDIRESLIRVSFEMERLSFLKLEVERLKEHAKLYNQYKNWLEMKLAMYKK